MVGVAVNHCRLCPQTTNNASKHAWSLSALSSPQDTSASTSITWDEFAELLSSDASILAGPPVDLEALASAPLLQAPPSLFPTASGAVPPFDDLQRQLWQRQVQPKSQPNSPVTPLQGGVGSSSATVSPQLRRSDGSGSGGSPSVSSPVVSSIPVGADRSTLVVSIELDGTSVEVSVRVGDDVDAIAAAFARSHGVRLTLTLFAWRGSSGCVFFRCVVAARWCRCR